MKYQPRSPTIIPISFSYISPKNVLHFLQVNQAILNHNEKIKFLLVTRQSKSKRLFMYNPKLMVESNNNLVGFADRHKHYELFMKEGFVMPKGGIKAGLKGQLVLLQKQQDHEEETANDDDEYEYE